MTKCLITFKLVHMTIPNYDRVTRLLIHTQLKFQILLQSKSKIPAFFVVFLHTGPYKRKPRSGAKSFVYSAFCIMQTLYRHMEVKDLLKNLKHEKTILYNRNPRRRMTLPVLKYQFIFCMALSGADN